MVDCNGTKNKCFGCGNCCKIIPMGISWEGINDIYTQQEDKESEYAKNIKFILDNWTPIYCFVDIWRIRPDMRILADHYYTCKQFNKFNHNCMVYNNRPPVCKDYPFYGRAEHVSLIYEYCAFNEKIYGSD